MKNILENGSACPLEQLEESKRETDMKEALSFGNNKGAVRNANFLRKLIEKDVVHGYGLVLPLSKISFSTILPFSSIVFCVMIFIGAKSTPGI